MDALIHRFELTQTVDVSMKSLVVIVAALLMLWACTASSTGRRSQGHPRRRGGSGRGQPHGHQRQSHDLADLPDRRRHGGRGGVLFGMQYS